MKRKIIKNKNLVFFAILMAIFGPVASAAVDAHSGAEDHTTALAAETAPTIQAINPDVLRIVANRAALDAGNAFKDYQNTCARAITNTTNIIRTDPATARIAGYAISQFTTQISDALNDLDNTVRDRDFTIYLNAFNASAVDRAIVDDYDDARDAAIAAATVDAATVVDVAIVTCDLAIDVARNPRNATDDAADADYAAACAAYDAAFAAAIGTAAFAAAADAADVARIAARDARDAAHNATTVIFTDAVNAAYIARNVARDAYNNARIAAAVAYDHDHDHRDVIDLADVAAVTADIAARGARNNARIAALAVFRDNIGNPSIRVLINYEKLFAAIPAAKRLVANYIAFPDVNNPNIAALAVFTPQVATVLMKAYGAFETAFETARNINSTTDAVRAAIAAATVDAAEAIHVIDVDPNLPRLLVIRSATVVITAVRRAAAYAVARAPAYAEAAEAALPAANRYVELADDARSLAAKLACLAPEITNIVKAELAPLNTPDVPNAGS
jgi:hypothetical protein